MATAAYPKHLTDWCSAQLQAFLGVPDDGLQMTKHLLSISTKASLAEYTSDILGANRAVAEFTDELWRRKTGEKKQTTAQQRAGWSTPAAPQNTTAAKPTGNNQQQQARDTKQAPAVASSSSASASTPIDPRTVRMVPLKRDDDDDIFGGTNTLAKAKESVQQQQSQSQQEVDWQRGRNLKVKYVVSKESAASGPVRRQCFCQAVTHPLFTNCTACGKIVCQQEGEGPCFFCGSMVTAAGTFASEEFEAAMRGIDLETFRSQKVEAKDGLAASGAAGTSSSSSSSSAADADAAALAKAAAHTKKLLAYASSAKTTKIYDDQSDWYEFESNSWLSEEERARKKRETEEKLLALEKRKAHTLTIDLENKTIVAHSSDAWKDSLEPERGPAWTEPEPAPTSTGASHGAAMTAHFASHPQLARAAEEMKIVSNAQYYSNDTLTGRAAQVYRDLKNSLRNQSFTSAVAGRSTGAVATPAEQPNGNPLLSSLRHAPGTRAAFAEDVEGEEGHIIRAPTSAGDSDLKLATAPVRTCGFSSISCGGGNDEDEPTNCAGALRDADSDGPSQFPDSSDQGMCISLWQPWASLCVLGIKRFEGRGWYTPYRGRLWIASGSREVDPQEVEQVEAEYRAAYGPNARIPFPTSYPTSALLGCVDLEHVWSQEEFQAHRSATGGIGENSESAFVFVMTHPRVLALPQSHSGSHKLYSLPARLYQGLQSSLKPVNEKWRTSLLPGSSHATQTGFDLWPTARKPLTSANALLQPKASLQVLQPGLIIVKQALTLSTQQALLDAVRHIGLLGNDVGFANPVPVVQQAGGPTQPTMELHSKMLALGMRYNQATKKFDRMTPSNRPMHAIPSVLMEHAGRALRFAIDYLKSHGAPGAYRDYTFDLVTAKYFPPPSSSTSSSGRTPVFMHQEDVQSGNECFPSVVLCIGDSVDVAYGDSIQPAHDKYSTTTLASGEALLIGGSSRRIAYGVEGIRPNTKPRELYMRTGSLLLVFRKAL